MRDHLLKYFWAYLALVILVGEAASTCNWATMCWILCTACAQMRIADLLEHNQELEEYVRQVQDELYNQGD